MTQLGPRARSWSPRGVTRREVHLSLLPEFDRQTQSFAGDTRPSGLDKTRVFGGIERRVRLDPPEPLDVSRLTQFSFLFQRNNAGQRPFVVAFVNSKSGGQTGRLLMETLAEHIGEPPRAFAGRVCDLSRGEEPADTITNIARNHLGSSPRLLVCGGDGTVTWILTELENCPELRERNVPVAILPLGTGNDLARSLGWGGRLRRRRDLLQYLQWVAKGTPVLLDQWELILRPHVPLPEGHRLRAELGSHPRPVTDSGTKSQLLADFEELLPPLSGLCQDVYLGFWQNYYEIGAGAKVVTYVDNMRNHAAAGKCLFRYGLGRLAYAWSMPRVFCQRRVTDSIQFLRLTDSAAPQRLTMSPPLQERSVHDSVGEAREVVFANINSFVGGMAGNFLPADASPADGLVEMLLWRNVCSMIGTAMGCSRPVHPASAGKVAMRLSQGQYMEVDGEPWEMPSGCDVIVRHHRKVAMLRAPLEAPFWGGRVRSSFWPEEESARAPLLR